VEVIGAGGIGCVLGYWCLAQGLDVLWIEIDQGKIESGNRSGVYLDGHPPRRARFIHFQEWQPNPRATILLCTKCYDNRAVLERLGDTGRLVPVQNGFDPVLDEQNHNLEGIASFVSECSAHEPRTRITRHGRLYIGRRKRGPSHDIEALLAALARGHGYRLTRVPEILPYKHTKLMYNAAIGPLAAAAGTDNGTLLAHPPTRALFFALIQENYAILKQANISLARIGPFHPHTVKRILARPWLSRTMAWCFYPSLRNTYCSMSADLRAGLTELDYYNGHLIRLAGNFPCPLNRAIHALVRRMERLQSEPGFHQLSGLAASLATSPA
jgi:2-dehydropantoate 2-reductase